MLRSDWIRRIGNRCSWFQRTEGKKCVRTMENRLDLSPHWTSRDYHRDSESRVIVLVAFFIPKKSIFSYSGILSNERTLRLLCHLISHKKANSGEALFILKTLDCNLKLSESLSFKKPAAASSTPSGQDDGQVVNLPARGLVAISNAFQRFVAAGYGKTQSHGIKRLC